MAIRDGIMMSNSGLGLTPEEFQKIMRSTTNTLERGELIEEMLLDKWLEKHAAEQAQTKNGAPIIEEGKTLDELIGNDPIGKAEAKAMRAEGATDAEIWAYMLEY